MCYVLSSLTISPSIDETIVVVPDGFESAAAKIIDHYRFAKVKAIIPGGESREESVFKALLHLEKAGLKDDDIVLIQDGDRPNLSEDLIKRNLEAASEFGAAVTAVPATDSVLMSERGEFAERYLPRKDIYLAQTPQTFKFGIILKAHRKAREEKNLVFTDDASIAQFAGFPSRLVMGSPDNVKITTEKDAKRFAKEGKE